ncbi:DUF2514 domain-containing protein [Variovorax paradoxus]|uniref:DUF2514 domain-containing protein n=1 Tax=Variovorax paradoxus TaxID=34073 RepID=UPI001ABCA1D6
MTVRVIAAVLLTLAVVFGVRAWNAHLVAEGDAQGDSRVRAEWREADTKRQAAESAAAAQAQAESAERQRRAREEDQLKQQQAERNSREQAQREAALQSALARADSRNRGLLGTIADLNARAAAAAAAMSGAGQDSGAVAFIGQASTARELLGQCSSRYTAVAADADGLRSQVIGLQDFVASVCSAPSNNNSAQAREAQ